MAVSAVPRLLLPGKGSCKNYPLFAARIDRFRAADTVYVVAVKARQQRRCCRRRHCFLGRRALWFLNQGFCGSAQQALSLPLFLIFYSLYYITK